MRPSLLSALLVLAATCSGAVEETPRPILMASARGMASYKPAIRPLLAKALLPDVVVSASPRTGGSLSGGGVVGGDLLLWTGVDISLSSSGVINWSSTALPSGTKDVGFSRPSVGLIKVTNGATGIGVLESGKLTLTSLGTPATPVITQGGAGGATAYSYKVVAKLPDTTTTEASAAGSTATGNAVLDGTNYNIVTWAATTNAHCYDVWRTAGGATQGKIATCTTSPLNDTGLAGVGAGTEPSCDSTGGVGGGTCAVIIGPDAAAAGSGAVAIGSAVTGTGANSIVIGGLATSTAVSGISLGTSSSSAVDRSIAIGPNSAASNTNDIALGETAVANASYGIAIGSHATVGSIGATAFGHSAVVGTTSGYSIAIGASSTVPNATPNVLVGGASAAPLSNLYFAKGMTDAAPTAYTINGTGGSGSNIVGGDLQLAPGISTGLAVPGKVKIRNSRVIGTGSTPQTLADLAYFGDVAADGSTNFFNLTGTMPPSPSGTLVGALYAFTAAGGASGNNQIGLNVNLADGAAAPAYSYALNANNYEASGVPVGTVGNASAAATGVGVAASGGLTGGVFVTGAAFTAVTLSQSTGLGAGLLASNSSNATPIFIAADNTTKVFSIEDSGAVWAKAGTKTLTESAATSFVLLAIANNSRQGGIIDYCIDADDGTEFQTRCGSIPFAMITKAAVETCTVGTAADAVAVSSSTLTVAFTADTSPANGCYYQANAVSGLTQTTLRINYTVNLYGNAATAVTPQ